MNAIPMIEPTSWRRRAACLAMGLGLLGTSAAASAQTRLSLADLAAQIEALRGQVTTLTQANSNLQGQLDSLNANLGVVQATAQAARDSAATVATNLATIQANSVLALDGVLAYDAAAQTARFSGVDVQVVNGLGADTINGRGNLIVGYNRARTGTAICSKGGAASDSQVACESVGAVWAVSHKSGSHNLVIGEGHAYSAYAGVLFGRDNAVTTAGGSVLGGTGNVVRGAEGSVLGGMANEAIGPYSVVSAGARNRAGGAYSAIGGGNGNSVDAAYSVISGGRDRWVNWLQVFTWMGGGLSQPN